MPALAELIRFIHFFQTQGAKYLFRRFPRPEDLKVFILLLAPMGLGGNPMSARVGGQYASAYAGSAPSSSPGCGPVGLWARISNNPSTLTLSLCVVLVIAMVTVFATRTPSSGHYWEESWTRDQASLRQLPEGWQAQYDHKSGTRALRSRFKRLFLRICAGVTHFSAVECVF